MPKDSLVEFASIWVMPEKIEKGLEVVREMPSLQNIGRSFDTVSAPGLFWAGYDSQPKESEKEETPKAEEQPQEAMKEQAKEEAPADEKPPENKEKADKPAETPATEPAAESKEESEKPAQN